MSDKRAQNGRPAPISYRPPKGLAAEFHARVAASGLSVNAFITACIFGRSRRRWDERQALAQLLGQAAQISDRLHDLALTGGSENALLSFFKEKMMTVTRDFARDHGLDLPPGYDRQEAEQRRNRQLDGYDCIKQKQTGISHEERMAAVTDAWRRSDNGAAFVNALADLGYILARGRNKTRVVLVDFYGHTTALTRLIDDPSVRAKHVRDFLGPDYAPENLPTVEEAKVAAAERRKLIEAFETARADSEPVTELFRQQAARRQALECEATELRQRQHEERTRLAAEQKAARQALKFAYLAEQKRIRAERARRRPNGLAAFLGRVTGIALITRKVQRYRDRKRYGAYLALREALKRRQQDERAALARWHDLQAADLRRRLRALDQIEKRERQTWETAALKSRRQRINARHAHMPSLASALRVKKSIAAPEDAGQPLRLPFAQAFAQAAEPAPDGGLVDAFARASGSRRRASGEDEGEQEGRGDSSGVRPDANDELDGHVRTRFADAAAGQHGEEEDGDAGSEDLTPDAEPKARRRRKEERGRKARVGKTAQSHVFNDAAGGGEEDSGDGAATETAAPAAETKTRRRRRRRRGPDRETAIGSGGDDSREDGHDAGAEPSRRKRRRSRGQDPPEDGGPPRPRRARKRGLGRGM